MKKALIDGDLLVYRIGFTTQDVDEGIAKYRLQELVDRIMQECECKEAYFYITSTDKSNFRFKLFPDYKAQRKDREKPIHYDFIRNLLVSDYMAEVVYGIEADDRLGIELTKDPENQVLVSIDKDLDQIPGWHYNFVKQRMYKMDELEAWRSFYFQCLVGDKSTDNIDGCPKIGEVKATRSLEGCESEKEMFETVALKYLNAYYDPETAAEKLWLAGQLLWIQKLPDQPWTRPSGEVVSKTNLKQFLSNDGLSTDMKPTLLSM